MSKKLKIRLKQDVISRTMDGVIVYNKGAILEVPLIKEQYGEYGVALNDVTHLTYVDNSPYYEIID